MKNHSALIFLFLFLSMSAFAAAVEKEALVGGWNPIKNINDPHVIEIAKFAVLIYDRRFGKKLSFVKTIKGETQAVTGINYRLVLAANDGSAIKNYEAIVWEKSWLLYRNLTSFKPIG